MTSICHNFLLRKRVTFSHLYSYRNAVRAIKKVKKSIEKSPNSIEGLTFAKVILALESDQVFPVTELYKLNSDDFDLVIELLRDWRIDRFYIGKAKAFDTATHAKNIS